MFEPDIFSGAPEIGAPLMYANFPRVYIDVNRESLELDPAMFEDKLPEDAFTMSPRVQAGIGTIARVVSQDQAVYRTLLPYSEARKRLENCYFPYHRTLQNLIDQTLEKFGTCLLIDCHSMPTPNQSSNKPFSSNSSSGQAEIVLGDRWGASCDSSITELAERTMLALGYSVRCNNPYAGGYTTQHYGRAGSEVQVLQIEIDRSLYMDERSLSKLPVFADVRDRMIRFAEALCSSHRERLAAQ